MPAVLNKFNQCYNRFIFEWSSENNKDLSVIKKFLDDIQVKADAPVSKAGDQDTAVEKGIAPEELHDVFCQKFPKFFFDKCKDRFSFGQINADNFPADFLDKIWSKYSDTIVSQFARGMGQAAGAGLIDALVNVFGKDQEFTPSFKDVVADLIAFQNL